MFYLLCGIAGFGVGIALSRVSSMIGDSSIVDLTILALISPHTARKQKARLEAEAQAEAKAQARAKASGASA